MHYPGDPRTRTIRIHIGGAELAERRSLTPRPQRAATSALDRLSGRPEYSPASRYRCPPPARADGVTAERESVPSRELGQPIVGQVLQPNLPTCHWPVLRVDDVDQPQLLKSSPVDWRRSGPQV